jgi:hypothetical protein
MEDFVPVFLPEIHHFGGCPECGNSGGYLNIGRAHWFHCDEHLVKWLIGENLFSTWHDESEEVWKDNAQRLSLYREVESADSWEDVTGRPHLTAD